MAQVTHRLEKELKVTLRIPTRRTLHADRPTVAVDVFLFAMKAFLLFFTAWAILGLINLQASGLGLRGESWRDVIVGGLAIGSMYGLIALGYSMVYGILGFINFAHGEVFMMGSMAGFFVATAFEDAGMWTGASPVGFIIAFLVVILSAMLTSLLVAITTEKVAYRRLRGSPRLIPLITSIGVSFFLQYTVRGLFGAGFKRYPRRPSGLADRVTSVFGWDLPVWLHIEGARLLAIVVAIVSMVGLWLFVSRSKTGRAIRAVAEDREIAALMGINVDRTIATTFAVGGAMAGVAAIMWALLFQTVNFITGFLPGIKAFTAAVLGGIGNLPGAMLGGLILGMVEAAGPTLLSSLRWPIPTGLAYAVGIAWIAGVAWGIRGLRQGQITQVTKSVSLVIIGTTFAVLSFTVLPGFQVVIRGTPQLNDMIAFIVLIGVLMIRPVGLLGERLAVEERG